MSDTYAQNSIDDDSEISLALDDYISGFEEATTVLESIDKFRRELGDIKGDISNSSFKMVQTFIDSTNKHLKIPTQVKTTLEYYNNRSLKELALEGLGSIFTTIINAIKTTFKFIIDGIKSIFGISAAKREEGFKEDAKKIPEKAKEVLLEVQEDKDGKLTKYVNPLAKHFGSEVPLIHPVMLLPLFLMEKTLEDLMESPKRVSNMVKHTLDLLKTIDLDKDDNRMIVKLEKAIDTVKSTISSLNAPPSDVSKFVTLKGENVRYVVVVPGFRGIAVNDEGKYQDVLNTDKNPSAIISLSVFKGAEILAEKIESLNNVTAKFVEEVNSSSKEIESNSKSLISLLEKSTNSQDADEKSQREVYKLIREISTISLNYSRFFAKTYQQACFIRRTVANILLKK